MIITAIGFLSENQEKQILFCRGEEKAIHAPCLEVSCPAGVCPSWRRAAQELLRQREAERSCPEGGCYPGREVSGAWELPLLSDVYSKGCISNSNSPRLSIVGELHIKNYLN